MGESGWAVFLDFPDLGWQRAWQIGLDLRRVITIPYTGGSALACAQLFVPCAAVLAIGMVDYGPQQQRILTAKSTPLRLRNSVCSALGGCYLPRE